MNENQYKVYSDVKEFYKRKQEYSSILSNIDYYFELIEDLNWNILGNSTILVSSFKHLYKGLIVNDENLFEMFVEYHSGVEKTIQIYIFPLLNNTKNTLYSFRKCIEILNLSDAMTLFRKLKDDLFLLLYFLRLSRIKPQDYDKKNKLEQWNEFAYKAFSWGKNEMNNLHSKQIIDFLLKDDAIQTLNAKTKMFFNLKNLTKNLNNFVHSNGYAYITKFNPIQTVERTIPILSYINKELDKVFSYIFTLIFFLYPRYLTSPDYQDHIEMGYTPPENSQYWVNARLNNFINTKIKKVDLELKKFLIENTYMMIK